MQSSKTTVRNSDEVFKKPGYSSVLRFQSVLAFVVLILCVHVISVHGQRIQPTCGKRQVNTVYLLTKAVASPPGRWPWHAAIYVPDEHKLTLICGGSVIGRNTVLSAAHCFFSHVRPFKEDEVSVHVGRVDATENATTIQVMVVSELIIHPEFTVYHFTHDIAIVKLASEIIMTRFVQPVCLWSMDDNESQIVGKNGTVTGFGLNERDELPGFLQEAKLTVVDKITCLMSDPGTYGHVLTHNVYCAGGNKGSSACNGDSGGGMFFEIQGMWYVRGIVSFIPMRPNDTRLCDSTKYTVFTDVAKYHKWVSQSMSLLNEARVGSLDDDETCQTPTGTKGTCVSVKHCSYVQKILRRPNFTDYDTRYLDSLKCGKMKVCCPTFENSACHQDIANRIYLGKETARGELPWAGLLFYYAVDLRDPRYRQIVPGCGGTLVNERYVITAAHCTEIRTDWKLLFVRFNEFNTSSQENCTMINDEEVCRYDYAVESIIPHPDYDMHKKSHPNDICIVRLAEDVTFNNFVKPICLPLEPEVQQLPIVNQNFTVTGWGGTEVATQSDVQRHVVVSVLENDACNSVYKDFNVTLTAKHLCVRGLNGTDAACSGDGGGALAREAWGDWILFGVVSFSARRCGWENIPGVYTNVMKYLDWIEDEIFAKHYW